MQHACMQRLQRRRRGRGWEALGEVYRQQQSSASCRPCRFLLNPDSRRRTPPLLLSSRGPPASQRRPASIFKYDLGAPPLTCLAAVPAAAAAAGDPSLALCCLRGLLRSSPPAVQGTPGSQTSACRGPRGDPLELPQALLHKLFGLCATGRCRWRGGPFGPLEGPRPQGGGDPLV